MKHPFARIALLISVILMFVAGCSKSKDLDKYFPDNTNGLPENANDIYYRSSGLIRNMDLLPNGSLSLLTASETGMEFFSVVVNGQEHREIISDSDLIGFAFYADNDLIYVYNEALGQIEARDEDFKVKQVVMDNFKPFEVKEMCSINDDLYILCVFNNPYETDENEILFQQDGYIDYGERLYRISVTDGRTEIIDIPGIITFTASPNGNLYLYVHRNNSYYIDVFDPLTGKTVYSINSDKTGYIFSMAFIGKKMYYNSMNTSGISSVDLKSGLIETEVENVIILGQSDLDTVGNNLIYLDRASMEICSLNTADGTISNGETARSRSISESELVIGLNSSKSLPFGLKGIGSDAGIRVETYESPIPADIEFEKDLLLKLMAGDSDIDIYILYATEPYAKKLALDGVCYPLDKSSFLSENNELFFDNISDSFKTGSGHIWGLPLSTDINIIAAFENNMRRAGLTDEIFTDYFSMLEALKNRDNTEGVFIWGVDYGTCLLTNYITNSIKEGKSVNFDNDLFKTYFESMWDGWKINGDRGYANNPYLGIARKETGSGASLKYISAVENATYMDPETALFHMVSEKDVFCGKLSSSENMSFYPLPMLSKEFKTTISLNMIAVINPKGKNIDKALKYMESLADYLRKSGTLGIIYKDIGSYGGSYDTSSDIFRTIYDINRDAIVTDHGMINDLLTNEIMSYQHKNIDLTTAIRSMQRKEDSYRNE